MRVNYFSTSILKTTNDNLRVIKAVNHIPMTRMVDMLVTKHLLLMMKDPATRKEIEAITKDVG